jgi:predicted  nucleic acid-binding Zn-ribbon protein
MSERVSVNSQEFQAFLAENKQLVERYGRLLDRVTELNKANKELGAKLRLTQEKLNMLEQRMGADIQQADETLREARTTIARLLEEADRRLSE